MVICDFNQLSAKDAKQCPLVQVEHLKCARTQPGVLKAAVCRSYWQRQQLDTVASVGWLAGAD